MNGNLSICLKSNKTYTLQQISQLALGEDIWDRPKKTQTPHTHKKWPHTNHKKQSSV